MEGCSSDKCFMSIRQKKMQQNVQPRYDFAKECIRINSNFVHAPNYSDMLKKFQNPPILSASWKCTSLVNYDDGTCIEIILQIEKQKLEQIHVRTGNFWNVGSLVLLSHNLLRTSRFPAHHFGTALGIQLKIAFS